MSSSIFLSDSNKPGLGSNAQESAVLDCPSPLDPLIARLKAAQNNSKQWTDPARQMSLDAEYTGSFIPPSSSTRPRTLVLCFDGTDDSVDDNSSNVQQLFSMLKKDDPSQQLVYYQSGIGTYRVPQVMTPIKSKITKAFDMAYAFSLDQHIMSGYEFLMQNYKRGDKICIFGFSRGAFTARALASMIHKVGLLPANNSQQIPLAYKIYKKDSVKGWRQSATFKRSFSIDVEIDFVGVWDTVASAGFLNPRHLPFIESNGTIKTFRHALSLDEHRVMFRPRLFQRRYPTQADLEALEKLESSTTIKLLKLMKSLRRKNKASGGDIEIEDQKVEEKYTDLDKQTDVLEVWFAGCHSDIGGGAIPYETEHSLARIPFRWMIRQIFLAGTGIQFDVQKLSAVGLDPATLYPITVPRNSVLNSQFNRSSAFLVHTPDSEAGSEASGLAPRACRAPVFSCDEDEEDGRDAVCPLNDQLSLRPDEISSFGDIGRKVFWWNFECSLAIVYEKIGQYKLFKGCTINLGRPRTCPSQVSGGIKVHRSVKTRMEDAKLRYKPKLKFKVQPTWVD